MNTIKFDNYGINRTKNIEVHPVHVSYTGNLYSACNRSFFIGESPVSVSYIGHQNSPVISTARGIEPMAIFPKNRMIDDCGKKDVFPTNYLLK